MLAALLASQTAAELLRLSVCLPRGRGRTQQTSVTCRHRREAPGHRARPPGAPGSTYRQLGGGGDLRRCPRPPGARRGGCVASSQEPVGENTSQQPAEKTPSHSDETESLQRRGVRGGWR